MSRLTLFKRGFAGIFLVVAALLAGPAAALASPVNLETASPFAVLAGSTATNTGPSVLNGDLGVFPGTALEGFGSPAVVNGAIHQADAVAAQAQLDLTSAYDVAAEQPVAPADDLTGVDLGGLLLSPGAYRYTSTAQLTGTLILDAEGDPKAQFVFEIGSGLTTASASSVQLINGASPCNVHWQIGSSATLGSGTAFAGNVLALTSISVNSGATVNGRLLARNGQVSLINDVITAPLCETGSSPREPGPGETGGSGGSGGSGTPGSGSPTGPRISVPVSTGSKTGAPRPNRNGTALLRPAPRAACTAGFRATVTGKRIERVVFSLDGKPMVSRTGSPYTMSVKAPPGAHRVSARVTFTDATRAKTMTFPYRACAEAVLRPHHGPSQFTG